MHKADFLHRSEAAQSAALGPLVSVVIPAFNAAQTIAQTLQSVLVQSYAPLEIVVVDDGSTDGTAQVLDAFCPPVKRITQANGGLASARNAGCAAASGSFIALLDADDLCHPHRIALQVAALESDPDLALVYSDFDAFDGKGTIKPRYAVHYYSALAQADGGIAALLPSEQQLHTAQHPAGVTLRTGHLYPALALGNFVHPPTCMFRRGVLAAAGWFDQSLRNMCDWEWLVRAARQGKFGYLDTSLLHYRLSENQLSGSQHHAKAMQEIVQVFELIAQGDPTLDSATHGRFKHELMRARIWAADALAHTDVWQSLRYLRKALPRGALDRHWLAALAKCLLPGPVQRLAKSIRQQIA